MDLYQLQATYPLEKLATSAWRNAWRTGSQEMRAALQHNMQPAIGGLTLKEYNSTRAPVQQAIAAGDRAGVRNQMQQMTIRDIRSGASALNDGHYAPSNGIHRTLLNREDRWSPPTGIKGMYDFHTKYPSSMHPQDPHGLAEWVRDRYSKPATPLPLP